LPHNFYAGVFRIVLHLGKLGSVDILQIYIGQA